MFRHDKPAISRDMIKDVQANRPFEVGRVKEDKIASPALGHQAEHLVGEVAMGIDETKATASLEVNLHPVEE
jgi:hypothetical protein